MDLSRQFSISGIAEPFDQQHTVIDILIMVDTISLKTVVSFVCSDVYTCILHCSAEHVDSMLTKGIDECVDRRLLPAMVQIYRARIVAECDQLISECHRHREEQTKAERAQMKTRLFDLVTIAIVLACAACLAYRIWFA